MNTYKNLVLFFSSIYLMGTVQAQEFVKLEVSPGIQHGSAKELPESKASSNFDKMDRTQQELYLLMRCYKKILAVHPFKGEGHSKDFAILLPHSLKRVENPADSTLSVKGEVLRLRENVRPPSFEISLDRLEFAELNELTKKPLKNQNYSSTDRYLKEITTNKNIRFISQNASIHPRNLEARMNEFRAWIYEKAEFLKKQGELNFLEKELSPCLDSYTPTANKD